MTKFLDFSFEDLHSLAGLERLDQAFLQYLEEGDKGLAERLKKARASFPSSSLEESVLLLDLGPYVEDFLGNLFSIEKELTSLQSQAYHLAPLYRCKRLFVQRQVAKAYTKEEAATFDGVQLKKTLTKHLGQPYSDLRFAQCVLRALKNQEENKLFLEIAQKYAAWAMMQKNPSVLFRLPRRIDAEALIPLERKGQWLSSPTLFKRQGFDCTDPGVTSEDTLDQTHYCLLCHEREKDSCSKGLNEKAQGCPLGQKISEMNTLHAQGYAVGALSIIIVDNPMVAATGHRICNDCSKACIFQKQEPVNIPSIETHILESVLGLPWGVEIYSLLSRWNPLNLKQPLPKPPSGYKVLVAGMGPAGFTLAHYLLNEGHTVVGIDGLKIEPLEKELLTQPIQDWSSLKKPLSQRQIEGFGGVAEYGITARWDKNYLKLIRLLLERRSHFAIYDCVRLGGTLTLSQAFDMGFDHVALCLGAGRPNGLDLPRGLARGVRYASDFLMALQLTGAAQENSVANLQIRLPLVIVGGGLTAVDAATEALAYYPVQVNKFLQRMEKLGNFPSSLSEEETTIAEEFLEHARAQARGDLSFLEKGSTLVYRKRLQDSPSYRLNAKELEDALTQGVQFVENANPHEIVVDQYGHIEKLIVKTSQGFQPLPCRTLLIATGTQPNKVLEEEDPELLIDGEDILLSYKNEKNVSFFGDLHPTYQGSVVKAMASAKEGYSKVCQALLKKPPSPTSNFFKKLEGTFRSRVHDIQHLTPTTSEIIIKAPQAALNFKPGQFFRLQAYGESGMEGVALTGAHCNPESGHLSLIVLEMGGSSILCQRLQKGDSVALMGPTGTPTEIPQNETVLLIGGGLGNAVLFSIGHALKEKKNRILYVAGHKNSEDRFKASEIEAISDLVLWCCESKPGFKPSRTCDFSYQGNVIEGLLKYATSAPSLPLDQVDRIITIGSDHMMAAVARARQTVLKPYLNPHHRAIVSLNSPMQCMMKEICGQCIQTLKDPQTGKERIIFACSAQDQSLEAVDFNVLQGRLLQNSLLEKQSHAWIKKGFG